LPGSPKACKENMDAVLKVLPHALDLLLDNKKSTVKQFHNKMQQGETEVKPVVGHTCMHKHDFDMDQKGQSVSLDTPGL
jgi:gephyrin